MRLGEYLDRADLSGDSFVVTRGERPKAVLLGATEYLQIVQRLEAFQAGRPAPQSEHREAHAEIVTTEKLQNMLR